MLQSEILLVRLRACDYDVTKLSETQYAEVVSLARSVGIELPRPGQIWGSHRDAEQYGHAVTHVDA